ncbi:MAG: dephospho-CoA kinase [Flavobacteriaceae bacterium]|nr:dephospho-CoA kinase [Flavobacteriaceae bacterium]|tara:strand:+ start:14609 stop:15196 length:588 start_codon:yes stop_codon:yes gene_type:complete
MSKVIALTGGIGSGKTYVASIFHKLAGIQCFYSDLEAKKIMNENIHIKKEIVSILGPESYINNKLNSEFLRNKIFSSQNKLKLINDLVHEEVGINFQKWLSLQTSRYILKETAILFEHNYHLDVDVSILVIAPVNIRIKRIIERDSISHKQIEKIVENQWDDKKKLHLCDFFIENRNKLDTIKKVKELIKVFSSI